jgi:pimeloyl-ACP methyl ester carboxylesterase
MSRGIGGTAPTMLDVTPAARTASGSEELRLPKTAYASNGEVELAWQSFGRGPIDLVVSLGWLTHAEWSWRHPSLANFLRRLGRSARLIIHDKRGSGLSDRNVKNVTLEDRLEDLKAVMDAAGAAKAVFFGVFDGAAVASAMAARFPERVAGLVLHGGSPRLVQGEGYPHGQTAEQLDALCAQILQHWGEPILVARQAPSRAADAGFCTWLSELMRVASSPGNAVALLRSAAALDLRGELPTIGAPTLVLHRTGDRVVSIAEGRALAALISGARLVELPGDDHLPFVGDSGAVLENVERFLAQVAKAFSAAPARAGTR